MYSVLLCTSFSGGIFSLSSLHDHHFRHYHQHNENQHCYHHYLDQITSICNHCLFFFIPHYQSWISTLASWLPSSSWKSKEEEFQIYLLANGAVPVLESVESYYNIWLWEVRFSCTSCRKHWHKSLMYPWEFHAIYWNFVLLFWYQPHVALSISLKKLANRYGCKSRIQISHLAKGFKTKAALLRYVHITRFTRLTRNKFAD